MLHVACNSSGLDFASRRRGSESSAAALTIGQCNVFSGTLSPALWAHRLKHRKNWSSRLFGRMPRGQRRSTARQLLVETWPPMTIDQDRTYFLPDVTRR